MELAEIEDRFEIHDVYARYVHAVDGSDYDPLLNRVFKTDTTFAVTDAGGHPRLDDIAPQMGLG
jgi:hypothetical protein